MLIVLILAIALLLTVLGLRFFLRRRPKAKSSTLNPASSSELVRQETDIAEPTLSSGSTPLMSEALQSIPEVNEGQQHDTAQAESESQSPPASNEELPQKETPQDESVVSSDSELLGFPPIDYLTETTIVPAPYFEESLIPGDSGKLGLPVLEPANSALVSAQAEAESIEIEPQSPHTDQSALPETDENSQIVLVEQPSTPSSATDVASPVVGEEDSIVTEEEPPTCEYPEQTSIEAQQQIALDIQPDAPLTSVEDVSPSAVQATKKTRRPPKYNPSIRTGEETQPKRTGRPAEAESTKTRSFSMRLRIVFSRRNYQFSLLPERADDSPEELKVTSANGEETWSAYQDEWYQEITPSNLNALLGEGGIWESRDGNIRWVLSRREIYVLAPDSTISGFVQTSGLALGQNHSVLCTENHDDAVRNALSEAGCSDLMPIANGRGVPEGWILFTDVRPSVPNQHEKDAGIFNILRPVHAVRIDLVGGIRLNHSTWLRGHPPKVRVLGASDSNVGVLIDGQAASIDVKGNYTVSDWNSDGRHTVFCGGISKSYELANGVEDWKFFIGHSYRRSQVLGDVISTCGPMILPTNEDGQLLFLPYGNNCLVGSIPGQVVFAPQPEHIRTSSFLAQSDFDVVWSLPADSLRCNKGTSRVRLIRPIAPGPTANLSGRRERWAAVRWYQAILNASRKGLGIDPDTEEARNLWLDYKRRARELRRRLR